MARVGIVGAGNLGVFIGAHLHRGGHQVFFCVRRPPERLEVRGLGPIDLPYFTAAPPAADAILLTVKTYDTPNARSWFESLCRNGQPIAVVQNGVNHEQRIAPWKAVPVLSYVYVERCDGAYVGYAPPREHFTVPDTSDGVDFQGLFHGTSIQVRREPLFSQAAWRKMLHNCVSNPLTALAGRGLEILSEPQYCGWARQILTEGLAVAQAEGIELSSSEIDNTLRILASYPKGTRTSMLQDRQSGRRTEIDSLNGELVRLGRRHGIQVDANEELVRRLTSH